MSCYRFYPRADQQQDDIWDYTLDTWGEAQAEKYIRDLHQHIEKLCENKMLWRQLPSVFMPPLAKKIPIFFSHYQHHYIFFRKLSNNHLGIMSIIHDSMDVPVKLQEDLTHISQE